jgi:hypothetical protein
MGNIMDYLKWRGDLSIAQDPFNDIDNLILAQLAYVSFKDIIPSPESRLKITVKQACEDFFELNDIDEIRRMKTLISNAPFMLKEMALHPRFSDMLLSNYVESFDENEEKQFAAFHVQIGDGTTYVAYKGTDDTLIGWKEDFNMSFISPVPSQIHSVRYLNETMAKTRGKIRLGGHSKGGNLAIYAAMNTTPKIKKRIIDIYNNDGPGFTKEMVQSQAYKEINELVKTIVPQHSFVGMLLEHEREYKVVKSSENGLMEHDAMSWQVIGNNFVTVKKISRESKILHEAFCSWIDGMDAKQRSEFVDTLFTIIRASGAATLSDLTADRFKSANAAIKSFTSLDAKTRSMMTKVLKSLTGEYTRARRKSRA